MPELPAGTITFLFTDVEGSTQLWEQQPEAMRAALARHDALLRQAVAQHHGVLIKSRGEGDSVFAVFARATDAVAAALAAQRALADLRPQPPSLAGKGRAGSPPPVGEGFGPLRVRMALHTGEAELREGDYYGLAVNRCARLRAIAHGGQVLLSRATAELVRDALPEGAGLRPLGSHRLKDLQRPEQVSQLLHPDLPADFPPLRSLDTLPNNLPRQVTSFIGREREVAEVKRLLYPGALVTLTGAGGIGKTRLALQVAADLLDQYRDGVWLVELAPATDPALVPHTVAAALGVREEPGRPRTATLLDYLRAKQLLLLLDNCEHLVAACAAMAEAIMRACPTVTLLATSREALSVAGEQARRVPSLSLPEAKGKRQGDRGDPIAELTQYEAVRLFIDRAVATQPGFIVTNRNAPAIAEVCHRLDGIALAIELAAARVNVLSVEQIAARLTDRFRLLTGGSRTAVPRQQTLRAAIDWSHDLLSAPEQAVLRQLAAFAGGCTLAAAEAVCGGLRTEDSGLSGPADLTTQSSILGPQSWDVLDRLSELVSKSLVLVEEDTAGEPRYRLLETVRQYGRERLREAGETADVRERHRGWYLALAEQAAPELLGPGQRAWLERLETEHDNLRAALEWSLETREAEAALRLAGALWRFWDVRGHISEGRKWLADALALAGPLRTAARAGALTAAGWLAMRRSDPAAARSHYSEALAIAQELGDKRGIAQALHGLGYVAASAGDPAAARDLVEQSLALFREVGDAWGIATSLYRLGHLPFLQGDYAAARGLYEEALALQRGLGDTEGTAYSLSNLGTVAGAQGDYPAAQAFYEQSLAIWRELGNRWGMSVSLSNLAMTAYQEGDHERAAALYQEGLALHREQGEKLGIALSLINLGCIVQCQGDDERAGALYEESLALHRELGNKPGVAAAVVNLAYVAQHRGDRRRAAALSAESLALRRELGDEVGIAECFVALAGVAAAQGQAERAARLLGAAEALVEPARLRADPVVRIEYDRNLAAARVGPDEAGFAAAWAAGRALPREQAIAYALAGTVPA